MVNDRLRDSVTRSNRSVLVELFNHGDDLWLLSVAPDREAPVVARVPFEQSAINQLLDELPGLLSGAGASSCREWRRLSDAVVANLDELVDAGTRIVFIPHRSFHYLPLHLLYWNGLPLIE